MFNALRTLASNIALLSRTPIRSVQGPANRPAPPPPAPAPPPPAPPPAPPSVDPMLLKPASLHKLIINEIDAAITERRYVWREWEAVVTDEEVTLLRMTRAFITRMWATPLQRIIETPVTEPLVNDGSCTPLTLRERMAERGARVVAQSPLSDPTP